MLTLGAPLVVKIFAATMSPEWYSLTVAFAVWCLPQIFFYGLYTVLGQILNARENFGPYMWAPVLNNIVAVAGLLVILAVYGRFDPEAPLAVSDWMGTRAAMLGGFSTLGIVAQAAILIWPIRTVGIRFHWDFQWKNSGLGAAGKASWWVFLSMITGMIPTVVLTNAAAGATDRAESLGIPLTEVAGNYVYSTANMMYTIPTSLIVVSIATAMFTRLSSHAADGNMTDMRRDFSKTIRVISTLMTLCSVLMIVLAVPVSRVLAMTIEAEEVITLSHVLMAMCVGLVAIGAVNVLDRAYYAFEDMRQVFFLNLPFQVVGLVGFLVCGMLPPRLTVIGIGMVMSMSNIAAALYLAAKLRRRMGGIDGKRLATVHAKLAVIAVVTGIVGVVVMAVIGRMVSLEQSVLASFVTLVAVAPFLAALYFLLMRLFRMEELTIVVGPARALLRKVGVK